ncbi:MAG: hypothetical protein ONB23_02040 [candidate division KSB1 bacterium]|nr:hypothetical protein [candidate division KSB1 bacterium]
MHSITGEPSVEEGCFRCHGERTIREFTGQVPGTQPDVHYERGMTCFDCHPRGGFHGSGRLDSTRYHVADLPRCTNCHPEALSETTTNVYHRLMVRKVQCQVCHAQRYRNCYGCHVGTKTSQLALSEDDFRIGKNPVKDDRHPWDWVVLRHAPVNPTSYSEWGVNLGNFAGAPTWTYASPHNIQKKTPQNSGCYGPCHLNPALYLTRDYLQQKVSQGAMVSEEVQANESVVVERVP